MCLIGPVLPPLFTMWWQNWTVTLHRSFMFRVSGKRLKSQLVWSQHNITYRWYLELEKNTVLCMKEFTTSLIYHRTECISMDAESRCLTLQENFSPVLVASASWIIKRPGYFFPLNFRSSVQHLKNNLTETHFSAELCMCEEKDLLGFLNNEIKKI